MNTVLLIAFFLVALGFIWGLWLIFKGKVTQPVSVIMYFVGAVLAVALAIAVTVLIFPPIANWFLDRGVESQYVRSLQQRTDELFGGASQPAPAQPTAGPTAPVSPVAPGGGASGGAASAATPAPGQVVHVVQLNETLYRIGLRYGVSVESIQKLNGISNPNDIKAGQRLLIPKP